MTQPTKNILIVGVGGQGTLLTSRILARVAINLGYDVKATEVHGMAQRGGSVVSEVRYGEKIYSPVIKKGDADVILAFEKLEAARWIPYLKPGGKVIINDERVDPLPVMTGKAQYPDDIAEHIASLIPDTTILDATNIAVQCGSAKAANVVLVGILAGGLGLPEQEVEKAVREMVPAKALDINIKAYHKGLELAEKTA